MRPLAIAIAAALAGLPARAPAAPAITLNGVNIDGVTSQRFDNCTVVIDGMGNVDIQAKGYAVRTSEEPPRTKPQQAGSGGGIATAKPVGAAAASPAGAPPAKVSRRYFIAVENSPPGPQYDLGIFVNAQWIREVKSNEPQAVLEITKYLRPGQNKVTLAATKRLSGDRLAFSKDVALRVVGGEGNIGGDHLMIDVPLFETARTAAEMDDKTEEFVFDAR
jgi:hypothetical protein